MKLMIALIALGLIGCGKQESRTYTPPDPNRCPVGEYGLSAHKINFVSGGQLTLMNNFCNASGTYTCDSATRTLTLTITAKETTGSLAGECENIGTYSCSYTYATDEFYGSTRLLVTCPTSAKLNPTKTYDTTRWE